MLYLDACLVEVFHRRFLTFYSLFFPCCVSCVTRFLLYDILSYILYLEHIKKPFSRDSTRFSLLYFEIFLLLSDINLLKVQKFFFFISILFFFFSIFSIALLVNISYCFMKKYICMIFSRVLCVIFVIIFKRTTRETHKREKN